MDNDYNHLGNPESNHRKAVRIKLDRGNERLKWIQFNTAALLPLLFVILVLLAMILKRLS